MANEELGDCICPTCEGEMGVYQAKRKGAHLYSRCDHCGLDQRIGKAVQQYLWDNTDWYDRVPTPPANVDTEKAVKQTVTQSVKESVPDLEKSGALPDFDPLTEPTEPERSSEPKEKPKARKNWLAGFGVSALILAFVGMVWSV